MIGVFGKPVQINSSYGWNVSRIADFFNRENQPKGGKGLSFTYKVMLTPDIELP